jgi:hypothetical protein
LELKNLKDSWIPCKIYLSLPSSVGMGKLNKINAAPDEDACRTIIVVCPDDGTIAGYAIICDMTDLEVWIAELCGANPN